LDDRYQTALDGPSRDFVESSSNLLFIFVLALLLVYLVLAAQFESFRDPFIIMLTVPLALAGALVSLWYFNQTLNIFSQIGMIMLIGLVTKNGILIVEFANQRKEQGLSLWEAILDASVARFRPILMTTTSTVLGILPIALSIGAGAQSRTSMGIAVIGGLIVGSTLTLYVIPALYSYLSTAEGTKSKIEMTPERERELLRKAQMDTEAA
jgi:multidrug efflux pump